MHQINSENDNHGRDVDSAKGWDVFSEKGDRRPCHFIKEITDLVNQLVAHVEHVENDKPAQHHRHDDGPKVNIKKPDDQEDNEIHVEKPFFFKLYAPRADCKGLDLIPGLGQHGTEFSSDTCYAEFTMSDQENTIQLDLKSGPVTIALRPDLAPHHVARIKELIKSGFYDGLKFHRVIPGFMAQTGCPEGTGYGGSGQKIKGEFSDASFVRGTCGMARSANVDSGDSQFFICFDDASFLDGEYTIWGEVTEGMELIDGLAKGEPPRQPDTIVKLSLAS